MTKAKPRNEVKTRAYYAITNPITGMFWNGVVPFFSLGGERGQISKALRNWKPRMVSNPATQGASWARESTVKDRLTKYTIIRLARPDLPEFHLQRYEISPMLVDQKVMRPPTGEVFTIAQLHNYYGAAVADDYSKLRIYDTPERRFLVRFSTMADHMTKLLLRKHLPDVPTRGTSAFLTKDDLVMLRMAAPAARYYDLSHLMEG